MSKIALTGDALGTGTLTIAAPNTNTDSTLTLPNNGGTLLTKEFPAGTAAAPSITPLGDTDTGIFSPALNTLAYSTAGVERMRILDTGFVGIGTSSPSTSLEVAGTGTFTNVDVSGGGIRTRDAIELGTLGTGDRNSLIDFHSSGLPGAIDYSARIIRNVGVNGALDTYNSGTGNYNWVVNGTTRLSIFGTTGKVYLTGSAARGTTGYVICSPGDTVANAVRAAGYIEWTTDVGAVGTNYFASDERKKDNIAPCTFDSSALINQIDFIEFDWKPDSGNEGHVDVGVSAQQLQSIDARLVHELSDSSLMVSEPALVAHIAKALQEALAKITALEARITALEQPT